MIDQPESGEPHDEEPSDDQPSALPVPGTVLAAAILLYVGGGLTVLTVLTQVVPNPQSLLTWTCGGQLIYGLLHVGLGWAIQLGVRGARLVLFVLCAIGIALSLVTLFGTGFAAAVEFAAYPAVYLILLSTASARAWFKQVNAVP